MVSFSGVDAFWYVVAGAAVAVGGALVYSFRRGARWIIAKLKAGYLEWFSEAIEEHVAPQFAEMRQNAIEVKQEALAAATQVLGEAESRAEAMTAAFADHEDKEGVIVRDIVKAAVEPLLTSIGEIQTTVGNHLQSDEENFAAGRAALEAGQDALVSELQSIRAAINGGTEK